MCLAYRQIWFCFSYFNSTKPSILKLFSNYLLGFEWEKKLGQQLIFLHAIQSYTGNTLVQTILCTSQIQIWRMNQTWSFVQALLSRLFTAHGSKWNWKWTCRSQLKAFYTIFVMLTEAVIDEANGGGEPTTNKWIIEEEIITSSQNDEFKAFIEQNDYPATQFHNLFDDEL